SMGQHGDLRCAWARDLFRTARVGCDETTATRDRPTDLDRFWNLARYLRWVSFARIYAVGFLLDKVSAWLGRSRPYCRSYRHHDWESILSSEQPLFARLFALV